MKRKIFEKLLAVVLSFTVLTGTFQVSAKSSNLIYYMMSESGNASESGDEIGRAHV